jgi:hypothetical protein
MGAESGERRKPLPVAPLREGILVLAIRCGVEAKNKSGDMIVRGRPNYLLSSLSLFFLPFGAPLCILYTTSKDEFL